MVPQSQVSMVVHIECAVTVTGNRIEVSFPTVINGKPFNYSFLVELPENTPFDDGSIEATKARLERVIEENLPFALREMMTTLAETSLSVAQVPSMPTKAKLTKTLTKRQRREVSRQLKQKTGTSKVDESNYPLLLNREGELRNQYRQAKMDHDQQRRLYDEKHKRRNHCLEEWITEWENYANKNYPDLPFAKDLADGYTQTEVAHHHLASEFQVSLSALERFILPKARRASRLPMLRTAERM